jgi:type III restriction enzyme
MNIIVLDRIHKDFEGLRIFSEDPVVPDNGYAGKDWQDDWNLVLHKQDEVHATRPFGDIFLRVLVFGITCYRLYY